MPIRDNEEFCKRFVADTEEEAMELLDKFNMDISMLSQKFSTVTGVDKQDLSQEGIIGLARAKRDFEEGRSADFRIFAIYKIKDAMREFITSQASNIKVPQYIRDAQRLADVLRKLMEKTGSMSMCALSDLWRISGEFKATTDSEQSLLEDINKVKNSIKNLAGRSHTSIIQLLDRAEIMPTIASSSIEFAETNDLRSDHFSEEDNMVKYLHSRDRVEMLKEVLDKDEFELLYARFVEGKTLKELEPELGVKEETIVVRTNNIITKLQRKFENYESNTNTEETESGHGR